MLQLLIALGCLLMSPTLTSAERALILPLRAERAIAESERAALLEALYAAVAAQGAQPIPDDGSAPSDAPCAAPSCIEPLLTKAAAQHAVELTVWRAADGAISGVSVSVVTPVGERYAEGAELTPGSDLAAAVDAGTRGAYARLRRGPGPWLELDGAPEGASITVDGQASGALPRRVKVSGGLHRVVVSSAGYVPFDETITVPRNADALKHLTVQLRALPAEGAGAHVAPSQVSAASPWNYVIAGAAVAGAVDCTSATTACAWRAPANAKTSARRRLRARASSAMSSRARARPRVTTCQAYEDYSSKACDDVDDDDACGDPRFESDAYCEQATSSTFRCTTPCSSADDCDTGAACEAGPPKHCEL